MDFAPPWIKPCWPDLVEDETADTSLEVRLDSIYEKALVVRPRLPVLNGIFDLGPDVLIASHAPHGRIKEHLHDHLNRMHICSAITPSMALILRP